MYRYLRYNAHGALSKCMHAWGFALFFSFSLCLSTKRLRGLKVRSQPYDTPHQRKFCNAGAAEEGMRGKEEGEKKKEKKGKAQNRSLSCPLGLTLLLAIIWHDLLSACVFMCVCVCIYGCVGGPVRALEDCIVLCSTGTVQYSSTLFEYAWRGQRWRVTGGF